METATSTRVATTSTQPAETTAQTNEVDQGVPPLEMAMVVSLVEHTMITFQE